jgi:hypothetical protein
VDHVTWYEPVYQAHLASYSSSSSKSQIPTTITNPILCTVPHLVIPSVTESNYPTGNWKALVCKIRAMFLYYRIHGSLPLKYYGRKQANKSYLDNENVFAACRAWLLAQKITIVTPNDFRHVINIQIIPRLLANTKNLYFLRLKRLGNLLDAW